ncbi:MAG: 50S ribosomal protein L25 [Dehalococcoidia bacterium]|nr:50S ribosomal protein L25 [Dehalococcoidia bacterium]
MDRLELTATNRDILGKRVRHLRRQGITPVHLFGHGIKSLALQCDNHELEGVLGHAGLTALISLKLDHEKRPRTVVVREFDRDWRKGQLLHVDFYQVKMTEKIRLEIPVVLVGEAPALRSKANMLEHELETLTVECLPGKIPASIEVDVGSLAGPDQAIRVKDLAVGKDFAVLNDPDLVVAKVSWRQRIEEEAVEAVEEAAEAPAEAAPDKEPE